MISITVEIVINTALEDGLVEMWELAQILKCNVETTFNGKSLWVGHYWNREKLEEEIQRYVSLVVKRSRDNLQGVRHA